MRRFLQMLLAASLAVLLSGCIAPRGDSPESKRAAIDWMKTDTLNFLYRERPSAKEVIEKAPGYAVFSNVNAQIILFGGGGGYGVAVNRQDSRQTYMQMAQLGVGPGLGVQDIRVVFVFHSQRAFDNFVERGWEFGAQADAAAKASEKGGALTGEVSIDAETTLYTLTQSGLMAKINLAGTKYWRYDYLN